MSRRPTYSGSMRREADGSYAYRGFRIESVTGGWEIQHGPGRSLGIGARHAYRERVAGYKTRNQAGAFVDRYLARNAGR